jgi:hypothetical protein
MVRAKRQGTYYGHRRRAGAIFAVEVDAKESWFEDYGDAPAEAELPAQIQNAQPPRGKSFNEVMKELADPVVDTTLGAQKPMTLAEAAATAITPDNDLVG